MPEVLYFSFVFAVALLLNNIPAALIALGALVICLFSNLIKVMRKSQKGY